MADQSNDLSTDVEAIAPVNVMPSTTVPLANTNTTKHALMDLLTRWVFVETFAWSTNDTILPLNLTLGNYINSTPTALKSYQLPQMILDNSALIRQKLNNYLLMKADIEVDIKVNATPFQQGALLIAYFPRSLNTSKFRADGSEFLASVSSAPHRIIQLEQGNTATLTLPYANVVDYVDLSNPDNSYGTFKIYTLSPLRGAVDTETTNITVRARFVNPVVEAPTDNSLLNINRYAEMESERILARMVRPTHHGGLKAQSGTEGTKEGPVTRISNFVATVAGALGSVPVIGAAATTVGWVARMVSGVSAVFGWSKPVDLTLPSIVIQRPGAYMGNVEGKDYSNVLAQIADNAINPDTVIPENEDEMALSKIWTRPNIIGRIVVPKTQFVARDLLFSWEVSPWSTLMTQLDSAGQDFCLGSFSFSTMMYRLWRGSIHYSLSCVKTPYHSGRIMAVYFPNRTREELPITYDETMTTNNNVIFDLTAKADDEFSLTKPIEVPYTSNEPWKRTLYYDRDLQAYSANTLNTHCGVIGVYCINELVSPDTVASEVTFILSHQAGKDFEVGIPQIQLAGGFAPPVEQIITQRLISAINNNVPVNMGLSVVNAGETPNFFSNDPQEILYIDQGLTPATWLFMVGLPSTAPDGTYDTTIKLEFDGNDNYFTDGLFDFSVRIRDGQVQEVTSDDIVADIATNTGSFMNITALPPPVPLHGLVAQSGPDAGSDETPSAEYIAPISPSSNVALGTTGEYALSLRPLLKRTVHTRNLVEPVTVNCLEFNSVRPTALQDVGKRSWSALDETGTLVGGGLLPESWVNLISYIFRFAAGSYRSKVFLPWSATAKTSLVLDDQLSAQFGVKQTDPMFVQHGIQNYCLETTVPYYSQYRARTIGDQARGLIANQYIEFDGTESVEYHECGGDDLSYFFMVGPPVMYPTLKDPVPIPTISPSTRKLKGVL